MIDQFYIGGSPCSGKSTVAEILTKKYDLFYFKVDDDLERYTALGAEKDYEICQKQLAMSAEETWMRDSAVQCCEELQWYREIFEFVVSEMERITSKKPILAEGAAFLPELMRQMQVSQARYLCIMPTREFQVFHYRKRKWVPHVLEGCSYPEKAFENWMERDALFAGAVRKQCRCAGYRTLVTDGGRTADEMAKEAAVHFGLEA